jgi:Ca2+-binding EF-hand superfamily protein
VASFFKWINLSTNGFLQEAELRYLLKGAKGEWMSMVDLDKDGKVSFEEFHAYITNRI